jgi:hypothetical protein
MKKCLLLFFVLILFSGVSQAQLVFEENFAYSVGALLTANGYTVSSGGGTNALTVTSPGLSFPQYPSVSGNALTLTTSGEDDYKSFTQITSGTVYLSLLINVQSAQTGDYFIAISPSTSQTNYYARLHIKSSGSGFSIGISKSNEVSGGAVYGTTVFNFNTTYLVVVKHVFVALDLNDQERVFVFSTAAPSTEPATSEVGPYVETTKSDPTDIGFVTIRQGSGTAAPAMMIDGIRITKAWANVTPVEEYTLLPSTYFLSQNYPNPFNPSTVIKYQVPQNSFVNISVYDLLGNKISTLVNQDKAAGSYELKFDASNLPSGIYFYTIQTGSFTQTKKMILMK